MTTSKPRKQDRAITFLTQEEVQNLFAAIKAKRDRAIFAVAYRHGLRASEVGMLQLTDLDLKASRITINRVKGSMSGTYPMSPDTVRLLKSYIKSRTDASPYLFISKQQTAAPRLLLGKLWKIVQVEPECQLPLDGSSTHVLISWSNLVARRRTWQNLIRKTATTCGSCRWT